MASKNKKVRDPIKNHNQKNVKIADDLKETKTILDIPIIDEAFDDPKFTRRKLLNNWSKYEKDIDAINSEASCSTGKDFSSVLQSSEKVNFKYQYQNSFEDFSTIEEIQGLNKNFLSLDLNYLSDLLDCIPLHQRYDLSKDIFADEELENFTINAKEAEEKFKSKYPDEKPDNYTKSSLTLNINIDDKNVDKINQTAKFITNSSIDLNNVLNNNYNDPINNEETKGHDSSLLTLQNIDSNTNIFNKTINKVMQFNEPDKILPEINLELKTNLNNETINCDIINDKVNIEDLEAELESFLNI